MSDINDNLSRCVAFNLTFDDLLEAYRVAARKAPASPKKGWLWVIGGALFGVMTSLPIPCASKTVQATISGASMGVIFTVTVLGILSYRLTKSRLPERVRKLYDQRACFRDEVTLKWSEERLSFNSEFLDYRLPLQRCIAYRESPQLFLIYENDDVVQVLPRRVLTSDQDADLASCVRTLPLKV